MANDHDRPVVWALTKGEYSDYSVVAVFEMKALAVAAQRAAAKYESVEFSDNYDLTCFPYFASGAPAPQVVTRYERHIEISDDGSTSHERISAHREWEFDQLYRAGRRPFIRFVRAPIHKDGGGGRLEVRGTDQQAVDQAFSDNLARIKATADLTGKAGPQVNV